MTTRVVQSDLPRPTRHSTRDIPTRPRRIADGSPVNRMIDGTFTDPMLNSFGYTYKQTNESGNDAVGLPEND